MDFLGWPVIPEKYIKRLKKWGNHRLGSVHFLKKRPFLGRGKVRGKVGTRAISGVFPTWAEICPMLTVNTIALRP
jgi:hypothetical protein